MNSIFFVLGAICILASAAVFVLEIVGVFKFDYVLNRMHAAAMGDSAGIFLAAVGCMLINGLNLGTLKIVLTVAFFWMTSPVCANLVARLQIDGDKKSEKHFKKVKEKK